MSKPYKAPRRLPTGILGERIPEYVRQWATLYRDGWTCRRIALDTGWNPTLRRQQAGSASPGTVQKQLRAWGVVLRRPGGRGSIGSSVSVRLAELEQKVATMQRAMSWIIENDKRVRDDD